MLVSGPAFDNGYGTTFIVMLAVAVHFLLMLASTWHLVVVCGEAYACITAGLLRRVAGCQAKYRALVCVFINMLSPPQMVVSLPRFTNAWLATFTVTES